MIEQPIQTAARWTPDCQGKQNFDGPIVEVSTRYWPPGGGFSLFDATTGKWDDDEDRPEVLPEAKCSIVIRDEADRDRVLTSKKFTAATEHEVKRKVETWVQQQFDRITRSLGVEFEGEVTG